MTSAPRWRPRGSRTSASWESRGPGWILSDFDARWEDPALRWDLIDVARALEEEPAVVGASAHLLGIGRKGALLST
jgi:hypothetical protein